MGFDIGGFLGGLAGGAAEGLDKAAARGLQSRKLDLEEQGLGLQGRQIDVAEREAAAKESQIEQQIKASEAELDEAARNLSMREEEHPLHKKALEQRVAIGEMDLGLARLTAGAKQKALEAQLGKEEATALVQMEYARKNADAGHALAVSQGDRETAAAYLDMQRGYAAKTAADLDQTRAGMERESLALEGRRVAVDEGRLSLAEAARLDKKFGDLRALHNQTLNMAFDHYYRGQDLARLKESDRQSVLFEYNRMAQTGELESATAKLKAALGGVLETREARALQDEALKSFDASLRTVRANIEGSVTYAGTMESWDKRSAATAPQIDILHGVVSIGKKMEENPDMTAVEVIAELNNFQKQSTAAYEEVRAQTMAASAQVAKWVAMADAMVDNPEDLPEFVDQVTSEASLTNRQKAEIIRRASQSQSRQTQSSLKRRVDELEQYIVDKAATPRSGATGLTLGARIRTRKTALETDPKHRGLMDRKAWSK